MENGPSVTAGSPNNTGYSISATSRAAGEENGKPRPRSRRKQGEADDDPTKRRCISTACIACRKRKSKCDGNTPACAACSQVYSTVCIYDPNSDHRRKGVYKHDGDKLKTRETTLQTLITALLNLKEDEAFELVRELRACESLDVVADRLNSEDHGCLHGDGDRQQKVEDAISDPGSKSNLYSKMGDLRLDHGSVQFVGGTSHLIHVDNDDTSDVDEYTQHENPVTSWTTVTDDGDLILHLLNMYFTWHYTYFTTLSKPLFFRDFGLGYAPGARRKTSYCSPLLVNAMLALGSHFTSHKGARADPDDSATAGDHFFKEAKRLILEGDLHEVPRLTTVQALALMSVREAGCGREAKGWVYSGMSFRMACDMGLNLDTGQLSNNKHISGDEVEEDVRRITFWGCYLFDKCWSNYLGRLPQLPTSIVTVPKFGVFPDEESETWTPYTDSGPSLAHSQPSRTRAVALQISKLCEISNDLIQTFYNPADMDKKRAPAVELKLLSSIHTRLESWRRELPKEMEPHEGGLSSVLTMHLFFQVMYIHLFRPFLKYTEATCPLPKNVSPRKLCTQAATSISKLMRLYQRSHGLRQIPNICVYILHTACTLHLLNLPEKTARRDIVHGVKQLEVISEGWLCARRTLSVLSTLSRKWNVELPEEAATVLARTDAKFGQYSTESPSSQRGGSDMTPALLAAQQGQQPQVGRTQVQAAHNAKTGTSIPQGPPFAANDRTAALPPADAYSMKATAYPSATTTPQTSQSVGAPRNSMSSPSGIFGGIEQLLRDSQDWVMRDQTQLANGFENWTGIDSAPLMWTSNTGAVPLNTSNGGFAEPSANGTYAANNQVPMSFDNFDNFNFGATNMTNYDENSWYY